MVIKPNYEERFVLRKINLLGRIATETLNKHELTIIKSLREKGLINSGYEDFDPKDPETIYVTKLGKVILYMEDYTNEIKKFREALLALRYDIDLIPEFLRTLDLNENTVSMLNIPNFNLFCGIYDEDNSIDKTIPIYYEALSTIGDKKFDKSSKGLMESMLKIWDEDHGIYVCHPNAIFIDKPISQDEHDITHINWSNIDPKRMLATDDFASFGDLNCFASIKYVADRLAKEILDLIKKGRREEATRHLAIVEQYSLNGELNYIVRGIIAESPEGLFLAFNPEYEQSIPKTQWEIGLRVGGNSTPPIYKVDRNKLGNIKQKEKGNH